VWDAELQTLLLAHDPLGRHPVFYAHTREAIWFGSNVLALAASPFVSNRPNRLSLAFAAIALWPEAGETFFADISRLRAGHYLEVSQTGSTRLQKYWDPLPDGDDEWLTEREALDGFEPALMRAVNRCMEMDPDGIMLSGGVDSVTVAALATNHRKAHRQPPLVAFSGRPDVPLLQEEHMQSLAADALGLPHVVTRTGEWTRNRDDIELSLQVTPELPAPSRIYWVGTYMAFYRTALSHGLRVLLTGSGGDNWLAVADVHAADLIRRLRFIELSRFIGAAARTGGSNYPRAMKRLVWYGGIRPLLDSLAARAFPRQKAALHRRSAVAIMPSWLCPDERFRADFLDRWLARRTPGLDHQGRVPRNYYQHSLQSAVNPHIYYEFETAFHVDALCGIRLLSPYHDADLVQFFNRIPPAVLVHGNKYKGLLRPVVERHLPGLGFAQQRKDYPQQATDLDLKNLRAGILRAWPTFDFATLQRLELVDAGVKGCELACAPTHPMSALVRMFALMSAEIWTRAHAS
jgi:asparagine synthase (glutamine-hydrolysing)